MKLGLAWILCAFFALAPVMLYPISVNAQDHADDAYDPFADYSEFDDTSDEEADINFFRSGRFFSIAFNFGHRAFTSQLTKLLQSSPTYGINMTYFFDLRLALQIGFLTGDHNFYFNPFGEPLQGNFAFSFLNMDMKYYLNTQNISRGLADLNPFLIGGFSQVSRTKSVPGFPVDQRDSTMGINVGAGIEIPLNRKKSYFGLQMTYHYFNFKDEASTIRVSDRDSGVKPSGDSYDILALIGLNF